MAISIMNNMAAQMSLSELNKNLNKSRQVTEKLSSGLKVVTAKDDGAAYNISEKLDVLVLSLNQDKQNVQNAISMLKVAGGGIENIVAELEALKRLAIDAATDTNTDEDRKILQKIFGQTIANIDDIATTTNYNGKQL